MNEVALSGFAGTLLSLVFTYLPGAREWYESLEAPEKSFVMLALLFSLTGAIFAVQCSGYYDFGIVCSKVGFYEVVNVFFAALVANQSTYLITRRL